jgi:hypothetical protein
LFISMTPCGMRPSMAKTTGMSLKGRHPTRRSVAGVGSAALRQSPSAPMLIPCKLESRPMPVVEEAFDHTWYYSLSLSYSPLEALKCAWLPFRKVVQTDMCLRGSVCTGHLSAHRSAPSLIHPDRCCGFRVTDIAGIRAVAEFFRPPRGLWAEARTCRPPPSTKDRVNSKLTLLRALSRSGFAPTPHTYRRRNLRGHSYRRLISPRRAASIAGKAQHPIASKRRVGAGSFACWSPVFPGVAVAQRE